ncbi:hypothetical protein HNB49_00985 [Comamonas thiooxydans]|nr:hypothetical protein [Comamonas thiooxydans]
MALLSSQWGLTRTQSDFNDYLRNNQAVVAQLQELYAQGLQSGQALRNIVMDPSDGQAVENLGNARRAYDAAYDDLSRRVQGTAMDEIVSAIHRVTDIMGEISAASSEQSAGVAQVGEAVMQMDQATQQNAALVEESAAAAEGLRQQAESLLTEVSRFQLERGTLALR